MKLIFTLLISLLSVSGFAQEVPDSLAVQPPYTVVIDNALHNLNKSRVPYDILYDRVYPFAQITELQEGDTVSTSYFLQAFSELQRAQYGEIPDDTAGFNYRNARNIIVGENLSNRLPFFVLNARYATIDSGSIHDGRLVVIDSALHDGSNPASPYIGHSITLPVLGQLESIKTETEYQMYLAPFAQFENAASAVASVSIRDMTTNKEIAVLYPDETGTVVFDAEGDHLLQYTVTLQDGSSYKYYQWLKAAAAASYYDACSDDSVKILATVPFIGPTETNASAFGGIGQGEYRIFYSTQGNCTNKQLRKPIIIVDAWDPGDERKISHFFSTDVKINKLLYNIGGNNYSNLANVLRDKGYDVIILNFPKTVVGKFMGILPVTRDGGVDYIERNGMILAELIKQVNQKLVQNGSTEKLVVVGPSMGGQISRYALRWMELNGQNHNTRLWLSFDSPHLGANIPLGFQTLLQGLALSLGSEDAQDFYQNQLRSPAAGEMLIHQTYPDRFKLVQYVHNGQISLYFSSLSDYTNNQAPLRVHWRNTLGNIGYPQNLRRIALVNGSYNGGEYHTPGGRMLTFKGFDVGLNLRMVEGEANFIKNNSSSQMCFFEERDGLKTGLMIWAPLVWLANGGSNFNTTRVSGSVSSAYGPLDGAPGGMYDAQGVFESKLLNARTYKGPITITYKTYNMTYNICFIPTYSALDVKYPNTDWRSALNNYQLRCNNETPFHSYYAPPTNENHVTLTSHNVAWLMQELDNDFKINMHAAPVRCQDITYQLTPGISFPNNVTWSIVSGNGVSIVSGNSSSVTLRGTSNPQNGGQTIIEAKIYAGLCYPDVPYYTVRATIPAPQDVGYAISFGTLPGCYYEARVLPATTGNTYRWSDNGWNFSTASSVNTHIPPGSNGYVARFGANDPVWAIIQSNCVAGGTKTLQTNFTVQSPSGNDCAYRLTPNSGEAPTIDQIERTGGIEILPNPTTGDWLVHIYQPASQIQARLTNATGQTVYTVEETKDVSEQIVVPGTALSPGVYFLTLTVDGKVSNHRLMKQ